MVRDENQRPPLRISPFNNNHHHSNWKLKLRENCYRRIKEDRAHLLWKFRLTAADHDVLDHHYDNKNWMKSTFQDIVTDELNKIRETSVNENVGTLTSFSPELDDSVWEYDGLHTAYQGDCEEIVLEMQRFFYEDFRTEPDAKAPGAYVKTWEEEEDEYLARAVYEHMQLNDKKGKVVWCPICKQGELLETNLLIQCTLCEFKINRGDEVNLNLLQTRLAEAHMEHLDRGCKLKPKFCTESRFGLTALYIECQDCSTLEIII